VRFYENITEFAGKSVVSWDAESSVEAFDGKIVRISIDWDEYEEGLKWVDKFAAYLDHPASAKATGLVVGGWDGLSEMAGDANLVVEAIVSARERLTDLTAIYFADVISEECEISWIELTDLSPIFAAYPALEYFVVRGGPGLSLGAPRLPALRSLIVETGGLNGEVVREVSRASLPALEHLELWLGTQRYGSTVTVEDLEPILSGSLFPNLKYLGLRDSDIADAVAAVAANAPILERIDTLDLSMGTLGDEGAEALLASPLVMQLKKLDIHHHYCTDAIMARLEALDIEVDVSEREDESEYGRYVAVGE